MALNFDPLAMLVEKITEANAIGMKVKAAKSDTTEQIKALVETSDDEKIVKFREARAKVLTQIETLQAQIVNAEGAVKEHAASLVTSVDPDFDVEAATKDFIAKRKVAYDTRKALEAFVPAEQINAALAERGVGEIVDLRGIGKSGSRGAPSGIKRPRISAATLNGEAVVGKEGKVDFGTLAKAAKADGNDLKKAAFEAAKTEDLNSLPEGTVVAFTLGEQKFTVTISGEKPGRKAAEKPAETPAK